MEKFVLCKYMLEKIQEGRIKYDEDENNFYIQINDDVYFDIVYCPFCGSELITETKEINTIINVRK